MCQEGTEKMMDIVENLRLNHEYCPKEVYLAAADEIEFLRKWRTDAELSLSVFMIVGVKAADDQVWAKNLVRAARLLKMKMPMEEPCT